MKPLLTAAALILCAAGVFAAEPVAPAASKALTPQQQKMGACAAANKGKKGDEYKNGVKTCMSAPGAASAASAATTPQQKMSACAAANKGKKGDEYKSGLKACLAASAPA